MSILMRGGPSKDFDKNKMLPREWAVTTDPQTQKQMVYMCFAAGVVKRMGTYEDFKEQIAEITKDIRDEYVAEFGEIEKRIKQLAETTKSNTDIVVQIKSDIVNTYFPQIQQYVSTASQNAQTATQKAQDALDYSKMSESHNHGNTGVRTGENADNSKYWSEQSHQYSDKAKDTADNIQSALDEVNRRVLMTEFDVSSDGNLIYTDNSIYNFTVENDGNLYWEVAS